jgi:ABC-type transport system involved in multi-copper enzyme maturation permease subunit
MNGDLISSLPIASQQHSEDQLKVANMIFKENPSALNTLGNELKDGVIISILFIIFSSPQVDDIIKKNIPNSNNMFVQYGVKCLAIIILYYILKNFQFSRKN